MKLRDILSLAFRTVRGNKLRTGITVAIIAFGIMALVGINTAIDAMKQKFTESFASMGANGFTIHFQDYNFFRRDDQVEKEKKGGKKTKLSDQKKPITKEEAELFKANYHFPAKISISVRGGGNNKIVSMDSRKTNPTVQVNGGDENYAELNGYSLAAGRSLNELDVASGRNV